KTGRRAAAFLLRLPVRLFRNRAKRFSFISRDCFDILQALLPGGGAMSILNLDKLDNLQELEHLRHLRDMGQLNRLEDLQRLEYLEQLENLGQRRGLENLYRLPN